MYEVGIVFGYIIAITIAIFVSNEFFKYKRFLSKELERKMGHIGFGIIALSAPIAFSEKWQFVVVVVYLLVWFGLIRKMKVFQGGLYDVVHLSSRPTIGDVLFPVAVLLMWLVIDRSDTTYYYASILVISFADSMASFIGKAYPFGVFKIARSTKSISGSVAFFIVTIFIFTFFKSEIHMTGMKFVALALAATIAEALSGFGLDNITIPVVLYIGFHLA